jgi:hypothetical protein
MKNTAKNRVYCKDCKYLYAYRDMIINGYTPVKYKCLYNPITKSIFLQKEEMYVNCEEKNKFNNCEDYKEKFNLKNWLLKRIKK